MKDEAINVEHPDKKPISIQIKVEAEIHFHSTRDDVDLFISFWVDGSDAAGVAITFDDIWQQTVDDERFTVQQRDALSRKIIRAMSNFQERLKLNP